jgi:hypothetical protein
MVDGGDRMDIGLLIRVCVVLSACIMMFQIIGDEKVSDGWSRRENKIMSIRTVSGEEKTREKVAQ